MTTTENPAIITTTGLHPQWAMHYRTGGYISPPIVAADDPEVRIGFEARIVPEGVWSGDGRIIAPGSLTTRELPFPLMGLITNTMGHDQAVAIGHFTEVELVDGMWIGRGPWAASAEAAQVRAAIRQGDVTGVSVDLDDIESELLIDADEYDEFDAMLEGEAPPEPPREEVDGDEVVVIEMTEPRLRVTAGRIMGATVVPFPAFQECGIVDLLADEPLDMPAEPLVAAVSVPVEPPRRFFEPPPPSRGVYAVTIDDDGRVHGYPAASWSDCHMSYADRCVHPPRSSSDYAYFKTGHVQCDDGSRVRVGQLCLRGGHADRSWSAARAMAHYDDTDSAFADVAIGENDHGIWIAGALRSTTTPEQVRTAMASGMSADWRPIGGGLELIALSCVNTPAFRARALIYEHDGLVASVIADLPPVSDQLLVASTIERIAASVGRSHAQRIDQLRARVRS